MVDESPDNKAVCTGRECSHCPLDGHEPKAGEIAGGRLALAAVAVFLLPLALAIGGGVVAQAANWIPAAGAGIGACVGVIIAAALRNRLFAVREKA
ncbi:MAG: hypothetical protein ACP5HU_03685 [Phycisphaerae bacterium]